jgi:glutamine synthetase
MAVVEADSGPAIAGAGADLKATLTDAGVHTVEVATPDLQGRLRGKRVPIGRFCDSVAASGVNIADAIYVFDIVDEILDNPYINMAAGYLDCTLVPQLDTLRLLPHRPGYAIVFAESHGEHGLHPISPRSALADQISRCVSLGLEPLVATELEAYLCTEDWDPAQDGIQYSSLTHGLAIEDALADIRAALAGAGMEVEGSNAEYGPGQVEINTGPQAPMRCADSTALFKSIVKQVAVAHGMRATFMAKPWTDPSGNGMHVHTSLLHPNGSNRFASSDGAPNELMSHWLGGLMSHAISTTLLNSPTPNSSKRIRPYTFAPTHVHWGLDNRSVLARCIVEAGSAANRVEWRAPGADANPYLVIAALLAAGADGVDRSLSPPAMTEGDAYADPGDSVAIPADYAAAVAAFDGSALAGMLGEQLARTLVVGAEAELQLFEANSPHPDEVNNWERSRYMEHS